MRLPGSTLTLLAFAPLALAGACGAPRSALPHPLDYVAAGVDARQEASATREALVRAGWDIDIELEGASFIAMSASRAPDHRLVRVVTRAGVALALDSHETDGLHLRHGAVALALPPREGTHDLDGDGLEEIVVSRETEGRLCLGLFRVTEEGGVIALPWDPGELPSTACVESFRDVNGDGRLEAMATLRFPALARREIPSVEAPLELDGEARFRAGPPPVAYVEAARRELGEAIDEASRAPDAERAYRLAIESAALERVAGSSRERQLRAFDLAIGRVVLDEELAESVRAAREHVAGGWREAPEPP